MVLYCVRCVLVSTICVFYELLLLLKSNVGRFPKGKKKRNKTRDSFSTNSGHVKWYSTQHKSIKGTSLKLLFLTVASLSEKKDIKHNQTMKGYTRPYMKQWRINSFFFFLTRYWTSTKFLLSVFTTRSPDITKQDTGPIAVRCQRFVKWYFRNKTRNQSDGLLYSHH